MSERRFSESEIREVFERAARDQEHAARRETQEGLTLAEMQDVAASAGIAPEFVAAAARSVALGEPEQGRMTTGPVPRGVFRTEFLPGPPTDALWQRIVADCRRTFRAQGRVTGVGESREWRNGNLRVILEPSGNGSRLHARTRRDDRTQLAVTAAALCLVALFMAFFSSLDAFSDPEAMRASLLVGIGSALGAVGLWVNQRSWAGTRERQMAEVAARAAAASQAGGVGQASPAAAPSSERLARVPPGLDIDAPAAAARRRTRL